MLFDGHINLFGVNNAAGTGSFHRNPQLDSVRSAVNRTFRNAECATRPPFREMSLVFDDPVDEDIFRRGAVTGAYGYSKTNKLTYDSIIVAVHDRILAGRVYGGEVMFTRILQGINPSLMHSAFTQAVDRLYYQDGESAPIGWAGTGQAYRIEGEDKMPIGTLLAYIHGRVVVGTEDGYVIVGDHIYGNGLRDTAGAESFIEYQQNDDLGAIAPPFRIGEIVAMAPMRRIGTLNAQGELIVAGKRGFYALDLTAQRSDWLYGGIQTVSLVGRGAASQYAFVPANSDIWYAASDGSISAYKFERSEHEKNWGDTSLSSEVGNYLAHTDRSRLPFVSGAVAHNRLLMTCAIEFSQSNLPDGGVHRFGAGMVALDFSKGSTLNQAPGFSWDGLWTGPGVVQFVDLSVDGADRCFAISNDGGLNNIFELMESGSDDFVGGRRRSIVGFYETCHLFGRVAATEPVVTKTLHDVKLDVSASSGSPVVSIDYTPDNTREWFRISQLTFDAPENPSIFSDGGVSTFLDRTGVISSGSPEPSDQSKILCANAYSANSFRIRVGVVGKATFSQMVCSASEHPDEALSSCATMESAVSSTTSTNEELFSYRF